MNFRWEQTHPFSLLRIGWIVELQQGLKLIVLGECDDFHDGAKLWEDLLTEKAEHWGELSTEGKRHYKKKKNRINTHSINRTSTCHQYKLSIRGWSKLWLSHLLQHIQGDGVKHVIDDYSQYWTGGRTATDTRVGPWCGSTTWLEIRHKHDSVTCQSLVLIATHLGQELPI